MGFVHNDIKLDNICWNESYRQCTFIDFAMATRICDNKDWKHVDQKKRDGFFGNLMFASEALIDNMTPSRKCDMEALMNVICVMDNGFHPMIDLAQTKGIDFHQVETVVEFR